VEVLNSGFTLADAREVVARQEGFDSWQALISGADIVKETPKQALCAVLNSIEAQPFVANVQNSCDFYTSKLGFAVAFTYGNPPFYGQVVRDSA
jgi:hypothetical protein